MSQGRERAEWNRSSILMSILWASFRAKFTKDKAPKAMTPEDFNPYTEKQAPLSVPITALRDVFLRGKKRKSKPCSQ